MTNEREQLLASVMDAIPVAILLLDEVGTIVFTNEDARALFFEGRHPEQRNFLRLLAGVPEPLRKALLADADHIFSFHSNGERETFHMARRQLVLRGEPHTVLMVRPMTLELSHQENTVLRKAIRVIHHEFANSLTPVTSLLQSARRMLAASALSPKLEQMLTVIEERVRQLNTFLMGFAALGKLPMPRPERVSWEEFLAGLRPLLPDIAVSPAPAAEGWFDAAQVQQVLINLVKNAREAASPPGEIVLQVQAAPEGGQLVSVLDRGAGMTEEVLENATVPSFTTKPSGSGIGLALCREIINAHRGQLRILRREGGGTVVSFWLPPREPILATTMQSRARLSLPG